MRSLLRRRGTPPLTCQELVELVSEYLDDAMDATDRARFERHLAGCPACTEFLEQFRVTTVVLTRFTEHHLDTVTRDAMLATFRGWHAGAEKL